MEIFVEQSSSYEKCLKKITQKYGDNILILRKKDSRVSKFLGLFEKDAVEITFTVNEQIPKYPPFPSRRSSVKPVAELNDDEERLKIIKKYAGKNPNTAEKLQPYVESMQRRDVEQSTHTAEQDKSVEKLVETVERLVTRIEKQTGESRKEPEHAHIVKIGKLLEENDFSPSYITVLSERLKTELSYTEIENFQTVQKKLFELLAESVKILPAGAQTKTRIILLVGPTGVGKTTTLAKIAAQYIGKRLENPLKIKVITIDNWRIGAAHQMKRYCELMGIPLMIAASPTEFRAYMDIYREEADIICVDTIGRSPNDREKLVQMQEYFADIGEDAEIYLTFCAGTRINDIREIMKQYAVFKYKSLIITKFDETSCIGNLFSIFDEMKAPVTYITAGQAVPQDFLPADTEIFLQKLKGFSVDKEYIMQLCSGRKHSF